MNPQEIHDGLLKARDLMDKGHWIKFRDQSVATFGYGDNARFEMRYCALGAIIQVSKGNRPLKSAMVRALAKTILPEAKHSHYRGTITSFNDGSLVDWGQVSRMFRKSARNVLRGTL